MVCHDVHGPLLEVIRREPVVLRTHKAHKVAPGTAAKASEGGQVLGGRNISALCNRQVQHLHQSRAAQPDQDQGNDPPVP